MEPSELGSDFSSPQDANPALVDHQKSPFEMVADHEKDIAEFEKARSEVSNEDLKKFIDETIPVMKEHLEMAKKMKTTK